MLGHLNASERPRADASVSSDQFGSDNTIINDSHEALAQIAIDSHTLHQKLAQLKWTSKPRRLETTRSELAMSLLTDIVLVIVSMLFFGMIPRYDKLLVD